MPTAGTLSRARRVATRIGLRLIPVGAILASTALIATPAHAELVTQIRSWKTGRCLDSNFKGEVYTQPCNAPHTNRHQYWIFTGGHLKNDATGRCLDSNGDGRLYTLPCQWPNTWQDWEAQQGRARDVAIIQNLRTGLVLDSNEGGGAYTHRRNGGFYQDWKLGF
ncbi:xylanase [Spongiactinospora rosea]|uniref:Xylanase n=1 Tax=Spongiactinospora rosea TaxID=2248750 RepID=A0A366LX11_9ACTN|nr:ricin-type beta-trefoil lectin domain protein [Spongiactinospora rosea]RBQ18461.1 xylanase [Spongiactinospora rosea]